MRTFKFLIALLIVIANNSILFSNQENFDGEINGSFISHHDNHNNLFYILTANLELTKVNLENNLYETTILKVNDDNGKPLDNKKEDVDGRKNNLLLLFSNTLKNTLTDFNLIHLEKKLYLIHDGGGVVLEINGNTIIKVDDSFASMQKFDGDVFVHKGKIHHFGGYGFWRTNNTMIKFYNGSRQSNQWEELVSNNNFPNGLNRGISGFTSALWENEYFIYGGKSTYNAKDFTNSNLYKYNFNNDLWTSLGQVNYTRTIDDVILNTKNLFYVFNRKNVHIIDLDKLIHTKYNYTNDFSYNKLSGIPNNNFTSHFHKGIEHNDIHVNYVCNQNKLFTINGHNSKFGVSFTSSYDIRNIIDLKSAEVIPLFSMQRSRNDFFIPLLIVVIVIVINMLYKNLIMSKGAEIVEYHIFENNELRFMNTKIELDNNSLEIVKMLVNNGKTTSNDVVAHLVENGLSYDYASKVKNKIIESLNEKFKFITNSKTPFISINKSNEDKRIQILEIIKYNK